MKIEENVAFSSRQNVKDGNISDSVVRDRYSLHCKTLLVCFGVVSYMICLP